MMSMHRVLLNPLSKRCRLCGLGSKVFNKQTREGHAWKVQRREEESGGESNWKTV